MVRMRKKREDKRRRNSLIFVGIAAMVMILSGLYYIAPTGRREPTEGSSPSTPWNTYSVRQIGNSSILIKIKQKTSDLIALPDVREITPQKISSLINSSIAGVNYVSCDATDFYFLCTFNLERKNATSRVREKLYDKFREDYSVMQGYIGKLPVNISGTDEIYVIGKLNHEKGEYIRTFLFQKDLGGMVAFEEREIPLGNKTPAQVLNLTGYSFSGKVISEFNLKNFSQKLGLNSSQVNYRAPGFMLNETLENDTMESLKDLGEVEVKIQKNKSLISFNDSMKEIEKFLEESNLSYSFQNGTINFMVSINSSVKKIKEEMGSWEILGVKVKKNGIVSFPQEVIFNGKIIPIEKSDHFPVTLQMDTEKGDKINISISIMQFGEQIIPFGASEVE